MHDTPKAALSEVRCSTIASNIPKCIGECQHAHTQTAKCVPTSDQLMSQKSSGV